MVLEALAAVSLAGTIVQFVQFSCSLLSLTTNIKKSDDGLSSGHFDLQLIAYDIQKFSAEFKMLGNSNSDLAKLSDRSQYVANDLLSAIEKIRSKVSSQRHSGKCEHFFQALKSIWNKKEIEQLTARVQSLRDQIQLHITSEIRENQIKGMETTLKIRQDGVRATLRFTDHLSGLSKKLESIETTLRAQDGDAYLGNLADRFTQFARNFGKLAWNNRILKSLHFDVMEVRHAAIPEAHRKTFDWIFTPEQLPQEDPRAKIQFATWLASGEGIYWVTGKPGSGKSTLMKYLEDHPELYSLLKAWASDKKLVVASFYFWNAGTSKQKSLHGLLQSLLYHILDACPDLTNVLCPERRSSRVDNQTHNGNWTLTELREAFRILEKQTAVPAAFYFHIDGVDEYEETDGESYREIIRLLQRLSEVPSVKICLSSRPWNIFEDTIGRSNNGILRLHELTENDIELFAYESLRDYSIHPQNHQDSLDHRRLASEIRNRAQGVFLWVRLVVRSLRDGVVNDDPPSLLQERLSRLPTDLEPFFELILNSVDTVYQERMSSTFLTAIVAEEPLKIYPLLISR